MQTWAEPTLTVKEVQAILNDNAGGYKATRETNATTGKAEWVVSALSNEPRDLKILEGPLAYYLNEGVARYDQDSRMIILDPAMSAIVFNDGFHQRARDVQKTLVENRDQLKQQGVAVKGLTSSYDTLLSQVGRLSGFAMTTALFFAFSICGLTYGFLKELQTIRDIKTGKTDKEAHIKTRADLNESLNGLRKSNQKALDENKAELIKLIKGVEAKVTALTGMSNRNTNGSTSKATLPKPEPAFKKDEHPPKWKVDEGTNGTGAQVEPLSAPIMAPPPTTEVEPEPIQAPSLDMDNLEPTELMSVLDKKARDESQVQRLLEKMNGGDEGEPTVQTKRPKSITLDGLPGPNEQQHVSTN